MKLRYMLTAMLVLLIFTAAPASADFYRYTDSKGELHFVDDIAKVPKKYRKQLNDAEPRGNVSITDATPDPSPSREYPGYTSPKQQAWESSGKVELFVTSWCGYCKKMIRFLNEKGIPYVAYDIEQDPDAAWTHKELGGRGVPVMRIGSRVVHGYKPETVMAHYNSGN